MICSAHYAFIFRAVLYLTVFGTIIAFWLYYWLLNKIESTKAMVISLVTPLIAVMVGGIFLGEKLPPQTIIGGIIILTGVGLIVFKGKIKDNADLQPAAREI